MAAINDITGDAIQTRQSNENYRNNYDLIFGNKKSTKESNAEISAENNCDDNVSENCDANQVEVKP